MIGRRSLLALPFVAAPALACERLLVAGLPLRLIDGYPVVAGMLAGQAVSFLLDTGAEGMLMTPESAAALKLPLNGLTRIYGTGGSQQARVVGLPGLRLGGAPMPALSAPVAALPVQLAVMPPLAGLLGAALLRQFEVEIDVPGLLVSLYAPGCAVAVKGMDLAMEVMPTGEVLIPVRVNGQTLLAMLDTGSRATLLTVQAARLLGLEAPVSANTARGVDGERMPLGHVRVRMGLGDEAPVETPVSIAPLQLGRGDMLLGLDAMMRRRVLISYARGVAIVGPRLPAP